MKILLIQPPFTILKTESKKCHPPLGLAYLAAALKNNFKIEVLDSIAEGFDTEEYIEKDYIRYGLKFEDIKKRINDFSPDAVCISFLFSSQTENVYNISRLIKEIDRRIITIVGGAHPSACPQEVLAQSTIDFAIIGEGDETLVELLLRLDKGADIQGVEGIAFKADGQVKINPKKRYIDDLDSLNFPFWDIFPLERYFSINNPHGSPARNVPFLPLITSRGCPFECIFCSVHNLWGRTYRKRSAGNVLDELVYLKKKFAIKEVLFEDDNLTLDRERCVSIFNRMIERKLNLSWSVPNGIAVQTLDGSLLELMKKSGCYSISIGIESADEYILKEIIRKPITLPEIKPIIDKARRLNIQTAAFFVVGLPGETRGSLKATFRFAENLGVDNVNFFFATPLPGTRLWQLCREKGLLSQKIDYKSLKSDAPNFALDCLPKEQLAGIINSEKIKVYILYFLKNPLAAIKKISNKLKNDPKYFGRFYLKHFSRAYAKE